MSDITDAELEALAQGECLEDCPAGCSTSVVCVDRLAQAVLTARKEAAEAVDVYALALKHYGPFEFSRLHLDAGSNEGRIMRVDDPLSDSVTYKFIALSEEDS